MSIIITGLEMPTERESFNLTVKYNGTVLDTETGMQVAEAYELPPQRQHTVLRVLAERDRCGEPGTIQSSQEGDQMGKEKLAVSIMTAAMRKRTIAQALWEEAEKDLARGRQMLEEAKDAETLPLERS